MKKSIIFAALIVIIFCIVDFGNISRSEIAGIYINNNTNPIVDGPKAIVEGIDTLFIYADNRFHNKSWGLGNYIIENSFFNHDIDFSYKYEFGYAGFRTNISKPIFGKQKIWLDKDQNSYYLKIREFESN